MKKLFLALSILLSLSATGCYDDMLYNDSYYEPTIMWYAPSNCYGYWWDDNRFYCAPAGFVYGDRAHIYWGPYWWGRHEYRDVYRPYYYHNYPYYHNGYRGGSFGSHRGGRR